MNTLDASKANLAKKTISNISNLATIILVAIVDVALAWLAFKLFGLGYVPIGICLIIIIVMITVAFLVPKAHMFKWMAVGLSAWLLFSIFPIVYTIYNAFTNYGDGHLITQAQAIEQIQAQTYLPETGKAYQWIAYRSNDNKYLLWLKDAEGNTKLVTQVGMEGDAEIPLVSGENGIGELDAEGAPITIEGYKRLNRIEAATDKNLTNIKFGDPEHTIQCGPQPRLRSFCLSMPMTRKPTHLPTQSLVRFIMIRKAHTPRKMEIN